ncbi:MAG TPA: class IV lanthionine synthetase LanL [Candidatus Limnocylindrales bacterium]|nr:class IV lanthionine synthetase LanL [Candidatus Limnocylindrales bacterium]
MTSQSLRDIVSLGDIVSLRDIVEAALPGQAGWTLRSDGSWCHALPPDGARPRQGWKLHLSATPASAPQVLRRSVAVLARYGCAFKFATDLETVGRLISKSVDRAAGGKFITAYPDTDEDRLRTLAKELHTSTAGLAGPGVLSDRRLCPGSLVHYRYGAFTGVQLLGDDGHRHAMLVTPDGRLTPDRRTAWFNPPAWAPPDPFAPPTQPRIEAAPVLLGGRYAVSHAIRHAFSGGVFHAHDRQTGAAVIVKQARPHTAINRAGHDACDLRRHEARMLRQLEPTGVVPRLIDLLEQQGDLFLVQERIDGIRLREWATNTPAPAAAMRIARELIDLVAMIHKVGLAVGDLNPNNIMVGPDGGLRLVDLETVTPTGSVVPRRFTPGYEAPERTGRADPAADKYGLGATLFYLACGADPVLPPDEPATRPTSARVEAWLSAMAAVNPVVRDLAPTITTLMHREPSHRPALASLPHKGDASAAGRAHEQVPLPKAIRDAAAYLIATMDPQSPNRLWPTSEAAANSDAFAVHHGAAGVLAALMRAYQADPTPHLFEAIDAAAGWIRRRVWGEPQMLPGLHFGRSGTAWALLDAANLLGDQRLTDLAHDLAARLPLRWPNVDICHGVAGAGLTHLHFYHLTGDATYLDRADQAADTVTQAAQHHDGILAWPLPDNLSHLSPRLAGARHLGFAHGVAGIATFLLKAGLATGTRRYLDLAADAAATLQSTSIVDGDAVYWPATPGGRRRTHWCSGSSGVGTFLLRMWRHTGDPRYRQLVTQAATAVYQGRWQAGPSQCHGLAGDAEFLLDIAGIENKEGSTGKDFYQTQATDLATVIYTRHALRHGRRLAADDTGAAVVADYGVGLAGVLAFLVRLHHGGQRMWIPTDIAVSHTAKGGDPDGDRHRSPADTAGSRGRGHPVAVSEQPS